MHTSLYFDDPDEGLSRNTSHPAFVRIAPDDFYYDCADDFSPFGSDDGSDTLSALQDWYQQSVDGRPLAMVFLCNHLQDWDLPVPKDLWMHDDATKAQWLAQDAMNDRYLQAVCRAVVAVAFGQLKITGEIDTDVREHAIQALACQQWLNQLARQQHLDWKHADEESQRLAQMRQVLESIHTAV